MADIDTDRLRKIQQVAADRIHPDCHTARERLTEQVPAIADELDRLQAENKQIGEERDSLASSLAIETGKYRDAWAENQRLRKHIQYYSYCTRQGVRATEASYIEWEEAHKSLGFDIP